MPVVICERCNGKPVTDVRRVFEPSPSGGHRFILAKCHGERAELPFADQAGQEMKIFAKEN
jgi:hypothetical protein